MLNAAECDKHWAVKELQTVACGLKMALNLIGNEIREKKF